MVFDAKQKKRKAAKSAPAPTAKKTKSDAVKTKPASEPAAVTKWPARKRAAGFFSDDEEENGEAWAGIEGKNKSGGGKVKGKATTAVAGKKKSKKEVKVKEPTPEPEASDDEAGEVSLDATGGVDVVDSEAGEQDEEVDNQTATLLKGFESSDEEEGVDDGKAHERSEFENAKIPSDKKTKKKLDALGRKEKTTPGIIYLGRIPHGFYEHEMRSYFSQFGDITRLRLSRNKKTGHSKHYAFIEFANAEVAKIVSDTMHNYLMFGHILKCKVVPRDNPETIEKLFIGANKRFKPKPGAKLHKASLDRKRTMEEWEKKERLENMKRRRISEKLKRKGIDYEFDFPMVKGPVPIERVDIPLAIEASPAGGENVSAGEVAEVEKAVVIATDGDGVAEAEKTAITTADGGGLTKVEAKAVIKKAKKSKSKKAKKRKSAGKA